MDSLGRFGLAVVLLGATFTFAASSSSELDMACIDEQFGTVYEYQCGDEQSWPESDETVPIEITTIVGDQTTDITIDSDLMSSYATLEGTTTYLNTTEDDARWETSDGIVTIYKNGVIAGSISHDKVPAGYTNTNATEDNPIGVVYTEPEQDPCEGKSYWETYNFDIQPSEDPVAEDSTIVLNTTYWRTKESNPGSGDWDGPLYKPSQKWSEDTNPTVESGSHTWDFEDSDYETQVEQIQQIKVRYTVFEDGQEQDRETFSIDAQLSCD